MTFIYCNTLLAVVKTCGSQRPCRVLLVGALLFFGRAASLNAGSFGSEEVAAYAVNASLGTFQEQTKKELALKEDLSNKPGDKINDDQYFGGCSVLTSFVRGKRITIEDSMLEQIPVFERAKDICLRHKIDIADALQLVAMKEDRLRRIGAILVTADGPLEKAAKAEGVRVWNCMKGNPPPTE